MASPPHPTPQLAALTSCFAAVPPSAVPAVVDCVVASSSSSSSPSHLLSSLLHSFPDPSSKGFQPNHAMSHAAALCHLIGQNDCPGDAMRMVLGRVLVPLLKEIDTNERELLEQVMGLMCDAVSSGQFWELLGATVVSFCFRSIGVAMGLCRSDEPVVYQWEAECFLDGGFDGEETLVSLSLLKASTVLALLLGDVLRRRREMMSWGQVMRQEGGSALDVFVHHLIWNLSKLVLRMFAQGQEFRFCATRVLLQPLLISFADVRSVMVNFDAVQHKLSRFGFLENTWKCCFSLFSLGHAERLDAYNILSLYFSSTLKLEHANIVSEPGEVHDFDLKNVYEFWDELRKGLVDKDSLVRKQALYVLKISLSIYSSSTGNNVNQQCLDNSLVPLNDQVKSSAAITKRERWANKEAKSLGVGDVCQSNVHCSSSQDRWRVFLLLYEMLQEYGTHLVEAAWTHQVVLLFESTPQSDFLNLAPSRAFHSQMETFEGIFQWMAVLWERGFTHDNPQVRCLVMQSFLDIAWEHYKSCAQMIPRGFVLGPLIRGLNDVVHHKDFGIGGVYNSKTIKGAEKFFSIYSQQLRTSGRLYLVWSLASAARQDSFARAGLMTLAFCVASCACQSEACGLSCANAEEVISKCNGDSLPVINAADLLDVLWILSEKSKQHFNPKYRLKVCEQVLKAAASLISATKIPLNQLLHFISAIPREFTDYFGPLRGLVQKWFGQSCGYSGGTTLLNKLIDFPSTFVKNMKVEGSYLFDDEDVGAWEAEAQRWARTLLLVTSEEQHFGPVFMFIKKYGNKLSEQNPVRDWVPVKFLVIVSSLIEELEVKWRKLVSENNTIYKGGSHGTNRSEHSCPLDSLNEKLAKILLLVLGNMVDFGRPECLVFWSRNVDGTDLPGSVKGKLGGPSQRRLATSMTSAALQAIWSMRSISSIVSWCSHFSNDGSLCSTFLFLWEFCWKVIQHNTYDTEAGAELHLAAYEALVHVLSALSTALTSHSLDFVELRQTYGEVKSSFDQLVCSFLNNINNLLTNGVLTRSRRAVLMCWKWLCVDSLLCIPYNLNENESQSQRSDTLFSGSTLRSIFLDVIESLENASENSVLPILRCVRLVLGLLHSGRGNGNLSSLGINSEMMMQLVKSSWILHLSCNKRRVAPIAALLSAILHPAVFPNLEMHQTNGKEQGPLKWFIENLLDEGSKSPRTVRLAALHLTGLWWRYPKTLRFYMNELKLLSLYGSVAFDEDFEAELSENYEARIEVSMLAQSLDHEFTEVFINTELFSRVSVAVLFHQLWKQTKGESALKTEDCLAALHSGKQFLLKLLHSAVNDKDLSKELYKKYSSVHRHKVRVWQMICVLSHYVEEDVLQEVTSNMHICLYRNNLPAVRQYLETFAILIYLKFPALAEEQLIPIFHDNGMRPQALSSYVFIAANVILHSSELAIQINHLDQLIPPIVPFLTSHHHSLRGFTQLLVHSVLSKLWSALQLGSPETAIFERKCFEDLKKYLAENTDCVRLRVSIEGFLDVFDPNMSATPSGIFSSRPEASDFECVPVSVMERVIEFLNDVREDLRHSIAKDSVTLKNEGLTVANDRNDERTIDEDIESLQPSQDTLNFQKKITPHRDALRPINTDGDPIVGDNDISRLFFEIEEDDKLFNLALQSRSQAAARIKQSQQQLILVASFLDRIPNLAGLTRTCEIFKAAGLVVADKTILKDKQFQLISVTAEKWLPILEVPVNSVKVFLEKKRLEGYSVIGLEQTANSIPIDQFSFLSKTVLVLGREKEGIPVDIIHILDACVEIPQLGIVRSLNVHVSGAIAVWEYTRQRRLKQPSAMKTCS